MFFFWLHHVRKNNDVLVFNPAGEIRDTIKLILKPGQVIIFFLLYAVYMWLFCCLFFLIVYENFFQGNVPPPPFSPRFFKVLKKNDSYLFKFSHRFYPLPPSLPLAQIFYEFSKRYKSSFSNTGKYRKRGLFFTTFWTKASLSEKDFFKKIWWCLQAPVLPRVRKQFFKGFSVPI